MAHVSKKILVVEDDPVTLRFVRYTLEKAGYQVSTATNGLEGLKKAREGEHDLVILDLMLPGIDGFEVCYRLRAEPQTAKLPVLMLTAKAQDTDRDTALKVGADDYLTKPANPAEIISRVENLLAKKKTARSKTVIFLGLEKGIGTTTLVTNVAIALSQKDERVIAVDLYSHDSSIAKLLRLKPESTPAHLFQKPIDTIDRRDLESVLIAHQTGIRVMSAPQPVGEQGDISVPHLDLLLGKLREMCDYLLVDLPFQPTDTTRAVLTKSDLIIIVSGSKADALTGVRSTATLLGLLGISQERMGAVVIDREGVLSEWKFPKVIPDIVPSIGVSLLGIIPYEAKAALKPVPGGVPIILSDPDCPLAWSIRGVAQHIMTGKINSKVSSP